MFSQSLKDETKNIQKARIQHIQIEQIPENRKRVENFQLEVLKRKNQLLPMFEKYCSERKKQKNIRYQDFNIYFLKNSLFGT